MIINFTDIPIIFTAPLISIFSDQHSDDGCEDELQPNDDSFYTNQEADPKNAFHFLQDLLED